MVLSEQHRFRSTIPYYARYRVPYPDEIIAFVVDRCGIGHGTRVLDLGCGPGQLAVAFARLGATVTAMDPEPDMLAAAERHARDAGVAVTLVEGGSYDLNPALGRFHLVAMGRSFHWMDRDATLTALDSLVEPGGAIAIIGEHRADSPRANWRELLDGLREEFVPERVAERRRQRMAMEPQDAVLLRSAFSRLEAYTVILHRTLSPDEIVGLTLSLSNTSPEALGDQRPAFEKKLREGLARLSTKGDLSENVAISTVIAKRPVAVAGSPREPSR